MADNRPNLLFLCHRMPYPPDKGDKSRSYHWWLALVERFRVHLGAFIDNPADWQHLERFEKACASCLFRPLSRKAATIRSLQGFIEGGALTLPYYRDAVLSRWVDERMDIANIQHILAYSSAMGQYAKGPRFAGARRVIDFVDVDSDKWRQYALTKSWPLNWVYRREADYLAAYEEELAKEFDVSLFVSEQEAALFKSQLTQTLTNVSHVRMGVDTDYFDPAFSGPSPDVLLPHHKTIVFTGAMDYWPNIDAVAWFAREVFPRVRRVCPEAVFVIVGSNPGASVTELAGDGVVVTGRVPDVRPYLGHSQVVVAPMRIARGIQTKVLEGMAMARPVVVTTMGLEGIMCQVGEDLLVADDVQLFAESVLRALSGQAEMIGVSARRRMLSDYSWEGATRRLLGFLSLDHQGRQA